MGPLAIAAIGGAALWGGWKILTKGSASKNVAIGKSGTVAQVGDEVYVSPAFLIQSNLPTLPPNTLHVIVKVKGGDAERVQGPIVGWRDPSTGGDIRVPAELGSHVVQRSAIFRVVRNGQVIATTG